MFPCLADHFTVTKQCRNRSNYSSAAVRRSRGVELHKIISKSRPSPSPTVDAIVSVRRRRCVHMDRKRGPGKKTILRCPTSQLMLINARKGIPHHYCNRKRKLDLVGSLVLFSAFVNCLEHCKAHLFLHNTICHSSDLFAHSNNDVIMV